MLNGGEKSNFRVFILKAVDSPNSCKLPLFSMYKFLNVIFNKKKS